ncbi:MAG: HAD-IA family hydrolase [bacterium]|nr:HAD-IA family hydrolase [bacterium]
MSIKAILFDADGVIQTPRSGHLDAWREVLGPSSRFEEFLGELFAAERPALIGESSFVTELQALLTRWQCPGTLADALRAWTAIEVESGIRELVATLRRRGVACHLATNQEPYRAEHMSRVLGYREMFDREFYSCRLGVMKPHASYFLAILKVVGAQPSDVLFLDDHQANVDSARATGLNAARIDPAPGEGCLTDVFRGFGLSTA